MTRLPRSRTLEATYPGNPPRSLNIYVGAPGKGMDWSKGRRRTPDHTKHAEFSQKWAFHLRLLNL